MERFTVNQVAKAMKVSRATVYKWIKKGMPYYTTPGGRYRFDLKEVAEWCDNYNVEG